MTLGKFFDLSVLHFICKVDVTNLMGFLLELNYMKKRQHVSMLRTEVMYKKQWSSCPITDFTGRDFTIFILYPNTDHSAYQNIHKQLLAPGTSYVFNKCKDLKQTGRGIWVNWGNVTYSNLYPRMNQYSNAIRLFFSTNRYRPSIYFCQFNNTYMIHGKLAFGTKEVTD